jgi:hypothetical protein
MMLETLYAGVPMLTQPVNSRLFNEVWKNGYEIKENIWAYGVIERNEIAKALKRLKKIDDERARGLVIKFLK